MLPLPFHSLVVAFCHVVHLCYGSNNLATVTWQAMGMLYTHIVHIIPEFAQEGCTATLYMHWWSHTWFHPPTPVPYSDEAGKRDLTVAKRYAAVISTRQVASISESLKHELYQKFVQKKKKIPCAKIWAPMQRNVVLEACMLAANAVWHVVFQRLLEHLLHFQDGGGCSLYLHQDTCSVKCTFPGAIPESDVVCVCGTCGSKRGVRQWVPLDKEAVCKWPKLGLKSRATFKSCAARRKALKDKVKGKGRVGPIPQSRVSNPASVDIVPPSEGEDSAASFQGRTGLNEQQRVHPMRRTKLARVPIVDSDIEEQLVCPCGSGNSSNNSSSSSSSDSGRSSSPEDNDSDDDAVPPQYVPQIVSHHSVTTLNRNLNPRSIAVWLYIVLGEGWWMWMPCQVMAVLCRCSAKESTTLIVQAEMNRQLAFFGIRGFTASFSQVTMWLWVHFNSQNGYK